jgi:predicted Zn-dependent protease
MSSILLCILTVQPALARVQLEPCKNNISPEKQIELGDRAAQQVYREMPVLPDSSPVTQYVQALGLKLAAQAPGYRWPYNFHVVNVADINAFALPGGSIFVNLGTIQAAETEAQLAGVMAHEISHVVLQHSVCNIEKEQRVGTMAGIGQIAGGVLLGGAAGELAGKGIGMTAQLGFLKMSRGAERQADLEGVGILYDAGYDPRAMLQFFEIVEAKYGEGGKQFLSDHPNPGNRTEYVDREIATFEPRTNNIANTSEFREIHEQAAKMHAYTEQEVASGVWRRSTPNQRGGAGASESNQDTSARGASANVRVNTAPPQNWTTFQGNGFSMAVPSDWQARRNQNAALLAPPDGMSEGAGGRRQTLVCGVVTDVYKPENPTGLRETFNSLIEELARTNPGLEPGPVNRITVGDMPVDTMEGTNQSANNGRGEHDWIVGVPMGRGIRYLVFVAPEPDFTAMRPTFERILNSISLQ